MMKRLCIILILGCCLIGCSDRKPKPTHSLTCTITSKDSKDSILTKVEYLYTKEKAVSATITQTTTPQADMEPIARRQLIDSIRMKESLFNTLPGVKSVFSDKEGVYTLENKIDFFESHPEELSTNEVISADFIKDDNVSMELIKSYYNTNGVTCAEVKLDDKK